MAWQEEVWHHYSSFRDLPSVLSSVHTQGQPSLYPHVCAQSHVGIQHRDGGGGGALGVVSGSPAVEPSGQPAVVQQCPVHLSFSLDRGVMSSVFMGMCSVIIFQLG